MKKDKEKFIAFCGLDCASCEAFIATKNNDDQLRAEVARKWTERYQKTGRNRPALKPEDVNCRGCLSSGPIYLYCSSCEIRRCGLDKKIKNCRECENYRCKMLIEKQRYFFKPKKKKGKFWPEKI